MSNIKIITDEDLKDAAKYTPASLERLAVFLDGFDDELAAKARSIAAESRKRAN